MTDRILQIPQRPAEQALPNSHILHEGNSVYIYFSDPSVRALESLCLRLRSRDLRYIHSLTAAVASTR